MKSSKNLAAGVHWGELPAREVHKHEVITPDIIENVWRQVLEDSNSSDCDYLGDTKQPEFIQLPPGNPHVYNTIDLHKRMRAMENDEMLDNADIMESRDTQKSMKSVNSFDFLQSKADRPEVKDSKRIQHLEPNTARVILRHSIMVLLMHLGYTSSSDVALDTLTDVADNFLKKMTLLLKIASEQTDHGFPDAVERVLVEAGIGGVVGLHEYYREYVLQFEENVKAAVRKKTEEQKQLEMMVCGSRMDLDDVVNKLKFEELDEFGNMYGEVPTLQLLDPEVGFPQSLDAGFQMLHSLEQDELNGLEGDEEEVIVSDSPSTVQQTDNKKRKC